MIESFLCGLPESRLFTPFRTKSENLRIAESSISVVSADVFKIIALKKIPKLENVEEESNAQASKFEKTCKKIGQQKSQERIENDYRSL